MRRFIAPLTALPAVVTAILCLAVIDGCSQFHNNNNAAAAVSLHPTSGPPGVAASVNGENILITDVTNEAMVKSGSGILDQLIGNTLIEQEAKKENVDVTPADIDSRIADIRDMMKPAKLEDQLKQHNMTLDDMRKEIRIEIEVERMSGKSLPPVKMRHIREILISIRPKGSMPAQGDHMHSAFEAKEIAAKVQNSLKSGEKFEDLAKKYSDDASNKDKGGDIGIVTNVRESISDFSARMLCSLPGVYDKIFAMKSGEITQTPLTSSYGYHFIEIADVDEDNNPSDNVLYKAAKSKARESQFKVIAPQFVQSLREKSSVTVYLGSYLTGPAGVAATVNGENIMTSQVSEIALKFGGQSVLENKITDVLVDQEARKQKIDVDAKEVDTAVNEMRNRIKPRKLEDMLNQTHTTLSDFQKSQRLHLLAGKLLVKSMGTQKLVHARHILILIKGPAASGIRGSHPHTESEARAIISKIQQELKAGRPFDELARQYSEDLNTQKQGGDLGIVQRTTPFGMDFFTAAQALKKDEITSKPLKSDYGLHLIKAVSTNSDYAPEEKPLYTGGEKIVQSMEIQTFLYSYLKSLRGRSNVINYLQQ